MADTNYSVLNEGGGLVKAWVNGVPVEDAAKKQLIITAQLPFIFKWVAAMPDVHTGIGATIGSVIPTEDAIIPSAVGVDIGCGMMAVKTGMQRGEIGDKYTRQGLTHQPIKPLAGASDWAPF